ncbi:MAG: HAD-IA family hydrolase [Clostridia bacterium]
MKKYRGVLFDLDGTLVDSFDFHSQIICQYLLRLGYRVDIRQVSMNIGNTMTCVLDGCGVAQKEQPTIVCEIDDFYLHSDQLRHLALVPGARELLAELKRCAVKTGILSNSKQALVEMIVRQNQAEKLFDLIDGATAQALNKETRCALAMRELGLRADQVLYVGDTRHDIRLARSFGMDVCIINGPIGWEEDYGNLIETQHPEYVVKHIGSVWEAVGGDSFIPLCKHKQT